MCNYIALYAYCSVLFMFLFHWLKMAGHSIVSTREALFRAKQANLQLVEVYPICIVYLLSIRIRFMRFPIQLFQYFVVLKRDPK